MTDYRAEYECEVERADIAEDALANMRVRAESAEAKVEWLEIAYEAAQKSISYLSLLVRVALPEAQWPSIVTEQLREMEAEAAARRAELDEAWHEHDRQRQRGDRLAAELDEKGWRPVTEEPDREGPYTMGDNRRDTHWVDYWYDDGRGWDGSEDATHWYDLPPLRAAAPDDKEGQS